MKKCENLERWCFLLLVLAAAVLMLVRVFFGTEQTDEAYYLAEAHTVLQGNYPLAYNSTIASGMVFPMLPFMAIFEHFVPDMHGVFLYMRICFTVFRYGIIVLILCLLKRRFPLRRCLMATFLLVVWQTTIPNFSYNTNGAWLTLLAEVLLACAVDSKQDRIVLGGSAIAGALMALAVFSHAAQAVSVIFLGILLLVLNRKEYRIKSALCFALGGIAVVTVVILWVGFLTGFDHLLVGLRNILYTVPTSQSTAGDHIYEAITAYLHPWVKGALMGVASGGIYALYYKWFRKGHIPIANAVLIGVAATSLCWFGYILLWHKSHEPAAIAVLLIPILMWQFRREKLFWFAVVTPLLFVMGLIVAADTGAASRYYFLLPAFAMLWLCWPQDKTIRRQTALMELSMLLCGVAVFLNYFPNVYRDAPISKLTARVESGIYQGLLTTEQRAKDMPELENYIKNNTHTGENILFRDNVPAAYLMNAGSICDIRTWDHLQYTYGCNDPLPMYNYFINREMIPDKIIYVDFGRDAQLSIEDAAYDFNDFVNEFYSLEESKQLNDSYRTKIYLKKSLTYQDFILWAQGKDYLQ